MNILPLVFVLLFTLAIVSMAQLEKFKNASLNHMTYEKYIQPNKNFVLNQRQEKLFHEGQKESWRHVSMRVFLKKERRDETDEETYQKNRFLLIELMKVLYSKAAFFKTLKQKRSEGFLEELVTAIEQAAIKAESNHKKPIKRIQDIVRLDLEDAELQEAFYHMLKGTTNKNEQDKETNDKNEQVVFEPTTRNQERTYFSLLAFVNMQKSTKVKIKLAAPEVLKAIFGKDEIVQSILVKRKLVDAQNAEAVEQFTQEFLNQRLPDIPANFLDFTFGRTEAADAKEQTELNEVQASPSTPFPNPKTGPLKKGK